MVNDQRNRPEIASIYQNNEERERNRPQRQGAPNPALEVEMMRYRIKIEERFALSEMNQNYTFARDQYDLLAHFPPHPPKKPFNFPREEPSPKLSADLSSSHALQGEAAADRNSNKFKLECREHSPPKILAGSVN